MGRYAQAGATVAAAGIYTGGRISTNALAWLKTGAVVAVQAALLKQMLDKQKNAYDDIAARQRSYVEKALNDYILDVNNQLIPTFQDAYPDVPVAAPYVAVDPAVETFNTMVSNIANMSKTQEYVQASNYLLRSNWVARAAFLEPGFLSNIRYTGQTLGQLIRGEMPIGDVVEILTDVGEQACLTGRIGNVRQSTLRALGISRLRAQVTGQRLHQEHLASLNQNVMPLSSEATIDAQMQKPENRIALALQQAQLIQNSLQNINNTAAQKPPFRLAILQTKLQTLIARLTYDANKGNMVNNFVPNYAAVLGPAMNNVFEGINKQIGGVGDEPDRHPGPQGLHPGEGA